MPTLDLCTALLYRLRIESSLHCSAGALRCKVEIRISIPIQPARRSMPHMPLSDELRSQREKQKRSFESALLKRSAVHFSKSLFFVIFNLSVVLILRKQWKALNTLVDELLMNNCYLKEVSLLKRNTEFANLIMNSETFGANIRASFAIFSLICYFCWESVHSITP